jgi:hypothetical protein
VGDVFEADGVGDLAHRAGSGAQKLLGVLQAEGADQVGGGLAGQGAQLAQQVGAVAGEGGGERGRSWRIVVFLPPGQSTGRIRIVPDFG